MGYQSKAQQKQRSYSGKEKKRFFPGKSATDQKTADKFRADIKGIFYRSFQELHEPRLP